jgi:CRISPR system Cascade subunit CasA
MNVAFEPWIPIVTTTGERKLVSLCNVLTEGEIFADLAVRPHERVALMRLFLCVSHAALNGPKDYDDWCAVPKQLPEAAQKYLTTWKEAFELFHEIKPWLQVAALAKNVEGNVSLADIDDWTPVSKLSFAYATGNNTTLFDHTGMSDNRHLAIAETLLAMLTFQCFSPGGLISQVYWCGKQTGKSSKDGPCVSKSMIHAFLRDDNLLGTIHLNLPSYEDIRFYYGDRDSGKPVWEIPPTSFTDSVSIENATNTYVGRLVPMTRFIRIHPLGERMLLGDGLVYPSFSDGYYPEPTATVVISKKKDKEERALLSFRPAKALWRELAAVIAKRKSEGLGGPLSLRAIQDGDDCDLIVAALAHNKATIVDTIESVFHVPSKLRSPDGTVTYEIEVKKADALASRLGWAVETYRGEVDHGWEGKLKSAGPAKGELKAKLHALATNHYWTTVEKNLPLLMAHIGAIGTDAVTPTLEAWRKMLFKAAIEAYRIACGQETPRQIRAFAKGWSKLIATKDEPENNETKEDDV